MSEKKVMNASEFFKHKGMIVLEGISNVVDEYLAYILEQQREDGSDAVEAIEKEYPLPVIYNDAPIKRANVEGQVRRLRKAAHFGYNLAKSDAVGFLNYIRDYERESGNTICFDDRSSEQLYALYQKNNER